MPYSYQEPGGLILFGQTPRAARTGGRYIVSSAARAVTGPRLQDIERAARRTPLSDRHVVATKAVCAVSETGNERMADEVLVLAGMDLAGLNGAQRNQWRDWLAELLVEFGTLVTAKIDWTRQRSVIVHRAELDAWEAEVSCALRDIRKARE